LLQAIHQSQEFFFYLTEIFSGELLVRLDDNIQPVKQVLMLPKNFSQAALDIISGYRMSGCFFSDNPGKSRVIQRIRHGQYA
jgi:hypothetical protein